MTPRITFAVSPEYGTRDDVIKLADECHARGMKLMLDGVFNHMGRKAAWFQEAMQDEHSPYRDFFYVGPEYKLGYRAWYDVENLPELNLENPEVRARIFGGPDSVVQGYLRDGVDGWRLDVAFDVGFEPLTELTKAAHHARPGSLVIGEIWSYPGEWSPAVDATMNFYLGWLIQSVVKGELDGALAGRMLERDGRGRRHGPASESLGGPGQPRPAAAEAPTTATVAAADGPGAAIHLARLTKPLLWRRGRHGRRR